MGAARGQPVVAACTLCSSAGGGRRRPVGPLGRAGPTERLRPSGERGEGSRLGKKEKRSGPWLGRLAAGPIGLKVKEKFLSE
jgi:hypothetical protein